jgi:uncharacterized membrane protein
MNTEFARTVIGNLKDLEQKSLKKQNIDQSERVFSLIAGSYLLFKSFKNIVKHPFLAVNGMAASGFLIYRGATGICPIYQKIGKDTTDPEAIHIIETITVNVPREKVYAFWRELSNLPKFMKHLKSVVEINEVESRWTANTPGKLIDLNWNAEITHEEKGKYLGWQSTSGMIENAGKVEFNDTLNAIGTDLHIEINYFPPVGSVGRGITSLFNGIFEKMIREDIQHFKHYVEETDFKTYVGLNIDEPMIK